MICLKSGGGKVSGIAALSQANRHSSQQWRKRHGDQGNKHRGQDDPDEKGMPLPSPDLSCKLEWIAPRHLQ